MLIKRKRALCKKAPVTSIFAWTLFLGLHIHSILENLQPTKLQRRKPPWRSGRSPISAVFSDYQTASQRSVGTDEGHRSTDDTRPRTCVSPLSSSPLLFRLKYDVEWTFQIKKRKEETFSKATFNRGHCPQCSQRASMRWQPGISLSFNKGIRENQPLLESRRQNDQYF